jgi:tRNA-modifying protein YgfZ
MLTAPHAATAGALLQTRADLGVFRVTGGDRLAWLNGLVTQEVSKLAPGTGAYGLAVGKTGKILAELWFLASTDHVLVIAARDRLEALLEHFDKHLIMEDAELSAPLDRAVICAHGPQAAAVVAEARGTSSEAAMIDWTGRGDAAVLVAAEREAGPLVAALLAGSPPRALATEAEWEALRVAWGLPRFGVDYDDQTLPQEASLEKAAVSFTKGCYLGQETVFMVEKRGHPKKKLVRLAVEGDAGLAAGAEITLPEGGALGAISSATPADEGGWVAIGSVKYKHAVAETAVLAGGRAARVLGVVHDR